MTLIELKAIKLDFDGRWHVYEVAVNPKYAVSVTFDVEPYVKKELGLNEDVTLVRVTFVNGVDVILVGERSELRKKLLNKTSSLLKG